MSQEDLGRAIGLDRTAMNKIESGVRKITALELSDIAAELDVPMSSFFQEPAPALVMHRSSEGLDTADSRIDALLAKFADEVQFVQSLNGDPLGLDGADAVLRSHIAPPSTNTETEGVAEQRALEWVLRRKSYLRAFDKIAAIGLLAFSRDIGNDTADAGHLAASRRCQFSQQPHEGRP